jgi:hypothetical protein
MFTLKLYRRKGPDTRQKMHKIITVHRVVVLEIGEKGQALELWAFTGAGNDYESYYIGEPEEGMDAHGKLDLHLGVEPNSWWGWGLLENQDGKTSEHYRPASYG